MHAHADAAVARAACAWMGRPRPGEGARGGRVKCAHLRAFAAQLSRCTGATLPHRAHDVACEPTLSGGTNAFLPRAAAGASRRSG